MVIQLDMSLFYTLGIEKKCGCALQKSYVLLIEMCKIKFSTNIELKIDTLLNHPLLPSPQLIHFVQWVQKMGVQDE